MDEKKIQKAVDEFIKNPSWAEFYNNAPSKACKRYVALNFYLSDNYSSILNDAAVLKALKKEQAELEEKFKLSDWKHLAKYAPNNPGKKRILEKIKELS